jgi:hypothetical protein
MRTILWICSILMLILSADAPVCSHPGEPEDKKCDVDPQFCLANIRGTVTILNHPELGQTPGSSLALVFQSLDCKQCRVNVDTNVDGTYRVSLGPGRYRVVMRQGRQVGETVDMLAPDQPRTLTTGKAGSEMQFDIKVRLPVN